MTSASASQVPGEDGQSPRRSALAMDAATFRALGHRLVDQIAERLDAIPGGPVTRDAPPSAVRDALGLTGPLPESGTDPGLLLQQTAELLFDHSLFNAHPRFFGYITAAPTPIGMLGDLLAVRARLPRRLPRALPRALDRCGHRRILSTGPCLSGLPRPLTPSHQGIAGGVLAAVR